MFKRLQGNGSITIPAQIRRETAIDPYSAVELVPQENGDILLKRHNPKCVFCGSNENNVMYKHISMCMSCREKLQGGNTDDSSGTV